MCTLEARVHQIHIFLSSEIKSNENILTLCFDFMSFEALVLRKRCKIFKEFCLSIICLNFPVSGRISGIQHPPDIWPDIRYLVFNMAGYPVGRISSKTAIRSIPKKNKKSKKHHKKSKTTKTIRRIKTSTSHFLFHGCF